MEALPTSKTCSLRDWNKDLVFRAVINYHCSEYQLFVSVAQGTGLRRWQLSCLVFSKHCFQEKLGEYWMPYPIWRTLAEKIWCKSLDCAPLQCFSVASVGSQGPQGPQGPQRVQSNDGKIQKVSKINYRSLFTYPCQLSPLWFWPLYPLFRSIFPPTFDTFTPYKMTTFPFFHYIKNHNFVSLS